MFRLFAVFPYRQTPKRIFFSIFIPLGLLKAGRLGNLIEFMVTFSGLIRNATTTEEMGELSLRHTGPKVEWFLQVVDNSSVHTVVSSLRQPSHTCLQDCICPIFVASEPQQLAFPNWHGCISATQSVFQYSPPSQLFLRLLFRILFQQDPYLVLDRGIQFHLPSDCQHHFARPLLPRGGLPQVPYVPNFQRLH